MLIQGNAYRIPLPDASVHCTVTSPPYWGLRKYAGDQGRIWGGDPECEHEWESEFVDREIRRGLGLADSPASTRGGAKKVKTIPRVQYEHSICQLCGAWYGSLGLEPTPEQHTKNIVEICREVRRVLRDDGVFWLNYGDCYTAQGGHTVIENDGRSNRSKRQEATGARVKGLAQGSLMMMPHRVALALQQDGWIIRQDLVWFKRNPMPESIAGTRWVKHRIKEKRSKHASDHNIKGGTEAMLRDASIHQGIDENWVPKYIDCPGCEKCIPNDGLVLKRGSFRHTRSHEYVFQLVKGPKMKYWSNQEAVREGHSKSSIDRVTSSPHTGSGMSFEGEARLPEVSLNSSGRNPRSVLDVPTAPYKGAHYATFPPNLIAPLIRATCPRWACPVCGQGWAAVVEPTESYKRHLGSSWHEHRKDQEQGQHQPKTDLDVFMTKGTRQVNVLGYRPTCEHEHTQEEAVPGIVFDPFVGSGTTVKVAQDLLRRGIGLDISMPYLDEQAKVRTGLGTPSKALEELPLFQ